MMDRRAITRKSAGRKAGVGLLGVFVVLALVVYTVSTAGARTERRIKLRADPLTSRVAAGAVARYRIRIRRTHFAGGVALWVAGGLPPEAHARLVPATTRRSSSTLIVMTSARTPAGRHRLRLRAASGAGASTIVVTSIIAPGRGTGMVGPVHGPRFTIRGYAGDLQPGVLRALHLSIANPNRLRLSVTSVIATLQGVSAPWATGALPCTLADFSVRQFSGSYPLMVAPSSTRTLSELRIPTARWPQVAIIDRPFDQDGCQGASVSFVYSATARRG